MLEKTSSNSNISDLLEDLRLKLVQKDTRNRLIHVNRGSKQLKTVNVIGENSKFVFDILKSHKNKMHFIPKEDNPDEDNLSLLESDEEVDAEILSKEPALLSIEDSNSPVKKTTLPALVSESTKLGGKKKRKPKLSLQSNLDSVALEKRVLSLFRDAENTLEEQGVNTLYFAMGFLSWPNVKKRGNNLESPLILIPVKLVRNNKKGGFSICADDHEITTNLPLQEKLLDDFQFELPAISDDNFQPDAYFDEIEKLIEERDGWSIDRNGMLLGLFSFLKFMMMRDLETENWPEEDLKNHPLLENLLKDGFHKSSPLFNATENLDKRLDPADLLHVVPADASQTKVIEEVRAGRDIVVQGPPGTGKSQTIANIIAAAVHDGKKVLFVAEKMAALSVVYDRLKKIGLQDICIEIHSNKTNKKLFLNEIKRTLNLKDKKIDYPDDPKLLRKARDDLNDITNLLHKPLSTYGFTSFKAMTECAKFNGKNTDTPRISQNGLDKLDQFERDEISQAISLYADLLVKNGNRQDHPFFGTEGKIFQPMEINRLKEGLEETLDAMTELFKQIDEIVNISEYSHPQNIIECHNLYRLLTALKEWPREERSASSRLLTKIGEKKVIDALSIGSEWASAHDEAKKTFTKLAFQVDPNELRENLASGVGSWISRLIGPYSKASKELKTFLSSALPKSPSERLELGNTLLEIWNLRQELKNEEEFLSSLLGEIWRRERTHFSALLKQSQWQSKFIDSIADIKTNEELEKLYLAIEKADEFKSAIEKLCSLLESLEKQINLKLDEMDLNEIKSKIDSMRDGIDRYDEWSRICFEYNKLEESGLSDLLQFIDEGKISPEKAVDEFLFACAEARWNLARKLSPDIDKLTYKNRHKMVDEFHDLEEERMIDTRNIIIKKHLEQLSSIDYLDLNALKGEIAKGRDNKPIRKMMEIHGKTLQNVKPVFLMSPISIAQYLPPGKIDFDMLLIDEASQVRPEEAIGAVARCKQIVVVGDQKQLPPTYFFEQVNQNYNNENDDEIAAVGEMESVLTLCDARGLQSSMLEWHYRSRDPSLIAVNNQEFYNNRLILPPSPLQNNPYYGLSFKYVPGIYSKGSSAAREQATNRIEGEELVNAVAKHARNRSDLSLGIVAFSKSQSDMITEIMEMRRRKDTILDMFLRQNHTENVFIKNIENVQGDERDVIFISVGYGPTEAKGTLASMNFGPVNREGGERRLNVLFSRARAKCVVFCSFDPRDIDLSNTRHVGPGILKKFLEFSRSGQLDQPMVSGELPDNDFEIDIGQEIKKMGYPIDYQVGSSKFKIDIGVRHPIKKGRYILAVECDGATYHSSLWARERDRLRQDILENLGWKFHRIWSTDWFYRRKDEIERLRNALEESANIDEFHHKGVNYDTKNRIEKEIEKEIKYFNEQEEFRGANELKENKSHTEYQSRDESSIFEQSNICEVEIINPLDEKEDYSNGVEPSASYNGLVKLDNGQISNIKELDNVIDDVKFLPSSQEEVTILLANDHKLALPSPPKALEAPSSQDVKRVGLPAPQDDSSHSDENGFSENKYEDDLKMLEKLFDDSMGHVNKDEE